MYSDKDELLTKAKEFLKQETTTIAYMTWIKNLEIEAIIDNRIILVAQNKMQKDAVESRYHELIVNTFNFITNKTCIIEIKEKSEISTAEVEEIEAYEDFTQNENYSKTFLKSQYTFDTFVIGGNNKFAQAAAEAISESPITSYNPLFIYGGVGLGKTHLMHAIGNKILQKDPTTKILYVTSEQFINELVNSIRDQNFKNELFRNKYRNIDVLLIDDIQFLAGKKMGQEEFFHTFNELHSKGKRIVISSDRPPRDMPNLEERLKGRFEWGILADISMPDYETRLAILRKKVQREKIIIDDYILSLIATKIDSNVRELEGALQKIVAYSQLTHSPITIETAQKAIDEIAIKKEKVISAEYIQEVVAKYFRIDKDDLVSTKKSNDLAYPRQIAMYLCRSVANMAYTKIGKDFQKDHSTVMHAVNKIEKEIKENSETKRIVDSVKDIIQDKN